MNIYVGNIAHAASEEQLKALFEQYGTVTTVEYTTCTLGQNSYYW